MNYADALAEMLIDGTDSLWRGVHAMPEDKIEWRPEPTARTARELLEELAMTTGFSAKLIETQKEPPYSEDASKEKKALDELEKEHRAGVEALIKAMRAFPEEKLHDMVDLSWGRMSWLQVIAYPYWNLMYHWGQISYLQTMYGDKETH